jgi:hypothetical protein
VPCAKLTAFTKEITIMQSTLTVATVLSVILSALKKAPEVAEEINQKCQEKGLPPAFVIHDNPFDIEGNPDYRFEGFGLTGFLPKLSFWVHYKPGSPQHVEIGRFLVPISLFQIPHIKDVLNI